MSHRKLKRRGHVRPAPLRKRADNPAAGSPAANVTGSRLDGKSGSTGQCVTSLDVPTFEVDLDKSPSQRWAHVIAEFAATVQQVVRQVEEDLVGEWLASQASLGSRMAHVGIQGLMKLAARRFAYVFLMGAVPPWATAM